MTEREPDWDTVMEMRAEAERDAAEPPPAPCPVEAVFPDDRVPCILWRGHEGPHQYTPQPCSQCGCLPDAPWGCGCSNEECPCSEAEDEECEL